MGLGKNGPKVKVGRKQIEWFGRSHTESVLQCTQGEAFQDFFSLPGGQKTKVMQSETPFISAQRLRQRRQIGRKPWRRWGDTERQVCTRVTEKESALETSAFLRQIFGPLTPIDSFGKAKWSGWSPIVIITPLCDTDTSPSRSSSPKIKTSGKG